MEGMNSEVISFLHALSIKPALLNGYDKIGVYGAMKELAGIYENALEREHSAHTAEVEVLQSYIREAVNIRNECMYAAAQLEKRIADAQAEVFAAKNEAGFLRKQLESGSRQFEKERAQRLAKAQQEAARILREARAKV